VRARGLPARRAAECAPGAASKQVSQLVERSPQAGVHGAARELEQHGDLPGRVLEEVAEDDDGPVLGLEVKFVEDFEFDNGYVSPYLVTDPGSMLAVLDDPYLLFCAEKITDVRTLMPVLEKIMRKPRPLTWFKHQGHGSARLSPRREQTEDAVRQQQHHEDHDDANEGAAALALPGVTARDASDDAASNDRS